MSYKLEKMFGSIGEEFLLNLGNTVFGLRLTWSLKMFGSVGAEFLLDLANLRVQSGLGFRLA